jgi:[protein-PII] uridylyltransferase
MKNVHEQASGLLQQKTEELIARFFQGKETDFLKQHARLLDDYFRQAFETSMVGPRMDISKNPYTIIALGGYGRKKGPGPGRKTDPGNRLSIVGHRP